jgi:hypothetical protein
MIVAIVTFKLPAAPDIRYFETAVVVDNQSDEILADAA